MCGICGIASTRGAVDPERLGRMSATLHHRGPDSSGSHIDGGVAIAARRLAIIDLARGDQPIYNEDRSVAAVCNGELYGYLDGFRDLESRGHRLQSEGRSK